MFFNLDNNLIKVEPVNFNKKVLYLVSNNFYQAGGYFLYFGVILDLENKKVLYQTPEIIKKGSFSYWEILENGDFKISTYYPHYDFCQSCAFELADFIRYQENKFFSVNTHYKETFKKISEVYEKENSCYITPGGKRLAFEEIRARFGENYQCRSSVKDFDNFLGATPKEYFLFKGEIEKILTGNEAWILQ